jgi:hypothetical protein
VTNFVIEEQRAAAVAAAFAEAEPNGADGLLAVRRWFESLPPDQYPSLVALAPHLAKPDADERFAFGLKTLLDGLSAQE